MKASHFIVVYKDNDTLDLPFGWDDNCLGALCCYSDAVALFTSRKLAQQAIRISARYAALRAAQGKPVDTDFLDGIANVKIVPCLPAPLME